MLHIGSAADELHKGITKGSKGVRKESGVKESGVYHCSMAQRTRKEIPPQTSTIFTALSL